MGWALFLMMTIFLGGILYRRYQERALRDSIEGISKLGKVKKISIQSSFLIGPSLIELELWPLDYQAKSDLKGEEPLVAPGLASSPEEEMVFLPIRRLTESGIEMDRYLTMRWLGKKMKCEVLPMLAEHTGIWRYARVEIESLEKAGKPRKIKIPPWTWLTPGDRIGVIIEERTHWFGEQAVHHYFSPKSHSAYLASFQVHDGTEVEAGDLLMLLVRPIESPEVR